MILTASRRSAFTLIEIMIVVAIIAIALAMGMPAIYRMGHPEAMTAAVKDVVEVCSHARAQAILKGIPMELRIYPQERRFEVAPAPADVDLNPTITATAALPVREGEGPPPEATGKLGGSSSGATAATAQISEDVVIEMCDINFGEYKDEELGRVRFYPNGTCDDFTLILRSDKNEFKTITLEVVTGLANVKDVK